jgi:hypothetical protein
MKLCGTCKVKKPLDAFHRRRGNKTDGRKSMCKLCTKHYDRAWVVKNRERHRLNGMRWRLNNPNYYKSLKRKNDRRYIKNLSDAYLKKLITKNSDIKFKDVTQKMLDKKREQVLLKRTLEEKGKVYFIRCGDAVKIGFSTNIKKRLSRLQSANPFQLECIAWFKGTRMEERELHIVFEEYHIRGEWFLYNNKVREYLKREERNGNICRGLS